MEETSTARISQQDPRYRMTFVDLYVTEEDATKKVDDLMKQWSDYGWQLLSATAAAYTVHSIATPRIKYVQYWVNPCWAVEEAATQESSR